MKKETAIILEKTEISSKSIKFLSDSYNYEAFPNLNKNIVISEYGLLIFRKSSLLDAISKKTNPDQTLIKVRVISKIIEEINLIDSNNDLFLIQI